jgi:hypothetical protein
MMGDSPHKISKKKTRLTIKPDIQQELITIVNYFMQYFNCKYNNMQLLKCQ